MSNTKSDGVEKLIEILDKHPESPITIYFRVESGLKEEEIRNILLFGENYKESDEKQIKQCTERVKDFECEEVAEDDLHFSIGKITSRNKYHAYSIVEQDGFEYKSKYLFELDLDKYVGKTFVIATCGCELEEGYSNIDPKSFYPDCPQHQDL